MATYGKKYAYKYVYKTWHMSIIIIAELDATRYFGAL